MAQRIKKIAFLSQLEDMEAYVNQYQDLRSKAEPNESNNKNAKYTGRSMNSAEKPVYYNDNGINQYRKQNSEYMNNFLGSHNVTNNVTNNANSFPINNTMQHNPINQPFGYDSHQQQGRFLPNEDFNYYKGHAHQMYLPQQTPFDNNLYMQQYPVYQQKNLYSEYYKTDSVYNNTGLITTNNTGSSSITQAKTPPLSHSNTPGSTHSSNESIISEVQGNNNSLIDSYNKIWNTTSNSSVWS